MDDVRDMLTMADRGRGFNRRDIGVLTESVLLPEQMRERVSHDSPEKRLCLAILEDAINCLRRYRYARDVRLRMMYRQARQWIHDRDCAWPFAFNNVCDFLGVDSNCLRKALLDGEQRANTGHLHLVPPVR
jgi:hypothetical protein